MEGLESRIAGTSRIEAMIDMGLNLQRATGLTSPFKTFWGGLRPEPCVDGQCAISAMQATVIMVRENRLEIGNQMSIASSKAQYDIWKQDRNRVRSSLPANDGNQQSSSGS